MILITKAEARAICENLPNAHIVRTMKQKSKRGHYFCEETKSVMQFLENIRKTGNITEKAGVNNESHKKAE